MIKIAAQNISKNFGGNQVFKELNLSVTDGLFGIAGNNGSGKSTLLKCLANLSKPSSGSVSWHLDGNQLKKEDLYKKIGYAAPYVNLYSELTARENLHFIARLRNLDTQNQTFTYWLEALDVYPLLDIPFGKLSTGQQQRVKLATALVYEPPFLFLDEPGSNLDKQGRGLINQVTEHWSRNDRLLVLASNQPRELDLCDETISMNNY